jgi:hypothetical protein
MAVRPGRRLLVTTLFIALYLAQISIFATNYWAARFVVLLLGAFALLWAARAERNPVLVALFVLLGIYAEYRYVQVYHGGYIPHSIQREHMRDAAPYLKEGEFFWILSTALTNDGNWGGKLGQYRFEYTICPKDGDWNAHFKKLAERSRWLLIPGNGDSFRPGPSWDSLIAHKCNNEQVSTMKERLQAAGWHYVVTLPGLYEFWTADPSVTPVPKPAA